MSENNARPIIVKPEKAKGNTHQTQLKTIFEYLKHHVATASMVSSATDVSQKNICRYKRDLEQANQLWEVAKMPCKKTGFKAWYLTTDPNRAPILPNLTNPGQ